MAAVYDHARALVKAFRECDEFKNMKRLGAKVKSDSKLDGLLSEFRLRQLEIQALQIQGQQPTQGQVEHLQKLAKRIESEPLLKDYLTAETTYGQVLVEVQNVLAEVYNPDVPGALVKK
ncbi:MAG TPA: YlbF family regulator [Symbiobacteriaceae bacterium]|jgi:cell fate (sporulation/competence/biofilm development) regulator YlbF (YheA/YmcA/DUF963 family)